MQSRRVLFVLPLLIFFLHCAGGTYDLQAQEYAVTDVGTISGSGVSAGRGVNSLGHVVGCSGSPPYVCPDASDKPGGFEWTEQAGLRTLIPLPGDNLSSPAAINDLDQIAGSSGHTANGLGSSHAVIWSQGTIVELGGLVKNCGNSCTTYVGAISQNELVTGCATVPPLINGNVHAFLWNQSRSMIDLGTLGSFGDSCGVGVNQSGAVAGWLNQIAFATIGFLWTPADGMQEIFPLPGADYVSPATAINNLNEVVGQTAYLGGDFTFFHAYLWRKGEGMTDLGILGTGQGSSQAQAINDNTQIVGWSGASAFIWSPDQGMRDLNNLIAPNSGWVLNSANAITNNGLITGSGTINGQSHAFLLTPQKGD